MESNERQMLKVVIKLKFTLCAKGTTAFVSERADWKGKSFEICQNTDTISY